ncbi:cadherin-related family member 4 isoform X5 [Mustela erminea]|uniref:cadherin-related family member 4 isoform X5 n=1 Tax=Mustela erminea TaxID=36723 RepID=UPI0013872651|nr:cadherin-related family member 4 isoform X5 [Mustela erminea]
MALLRPPLLLLALVVSELHGLPWFINVSESQGPGAILYSFPINCTSYVPTLELLYVQPPTTFFNPPSLNRQQKTYMAMVTLSSSARLDALAVNHYRLQLRLTCGKKVLEAPLSVNVHRDPGHSPCAGQFANPGGEIIQVRETVTPGAQLYTLLLPGLQLQRAQLRINSAQDPPYFPGPFSINGQGWLLAPSQGLKGHAPKVFPLEVLVSFGQNQSCHRMLKVKVLPDPSSQISFLGQAPNVTILEDLAPGSNVVQVRARGLDVRYEILSPVPCPLFSIGREDGVVRTTAPLELASARGVAVTRLQVKAYERRRPWASVDLDVTVNVRSVNRWPPCCLPAMLVTEIPETTPVGTVLKTFTCTDPDSAGSPLDYELQFHSPPGPASLCLRGRALEVPSPAYRPMCWVLQDMKVNATLDCDTPGACFQHAASILVLDGGQPLMTREVHLLGSLDYELQTLYRLTVLVTDHSQDQHPTQRRSGSCTITIEVEDVNDYAPKCQPPFQELTIYAPLGHSVEVTKVSCWVPQEPQRRAFSYSIVGGNSQSRFSLQGPILVHKSITWGPQWPEQPHTYELLIRVADAGPSIPHLSTTATVIVHLIPWSTSTVTTRTHRSPVPSVMTPLLVTDVEAFWQPEPWFVVVLTVTSALFLLALGWLFNRLFQGLAQMLQSPSKSAQALLLNSIQGTEESIEGFTEAPRTEMPRAPSSVVSLQHFDGRAQDSRTGREYLFNTLTGARRWL